MGAERRMPLGQSPGGCVSTALSRCATRRAVSHSHVHRVRGVSHGHHRRGRAGRLLGHRPGTREPCRGTGEHPLRTLRETARLQGRAGPAPLRNRIRILESTTGTSRSDLGRSSAAEGDSVWRHPMRRSDAPGARVLTVASTAGRPIKPRHGGRSPRCTGGTVLERRGSAS
jgi:hypothetical protein